MFSSDKYNISWVSISCLTILAITGLVNYIIDPYLFYQAVSLPGINTSKAAVTNRIGFLKSYMVETSKAKTLIIGTSNLDIGLNPVSRYFSIDSKPVFNMAIPGRSVFSLFRDIQHASAAHRPETIIIGLQFDQFLVRSSRMKKAYPPNHDGEINRRRIVDYYNKLNPEKQKQYVKDVFSTLLSSTTLLDSLKTVIAEDLIWVTPHGLSSGFARFGSEVRNKGYYSIFRDVTQDVAAILGGREIVQNSVPFNALADIVQFGRKNKIKLIFVLPPSHAFQYELWSEAGLWSELEKWKQLILQTVNANNIGSAVDVTVWDFAFYNAITTEKVPAPGDVSREMKWFWEPIHFKKEFGELILKEIFSDADEGVGVKITLDNICQHLASTRKGKLLYTLGQKGQLELYRSISQKYKVPFDNKNTDLPELFCFATN